MKNLFKKASKTLVGVALVLLVSQIIVPAISTHADGFIPGFNTKPGEADFYKVRNITKGTNFGGSVQADPKDVLEFSIYFHNSVPYSVAHDSRVMANFPAQTKKGSVTATGFLGSKDAQPAEIQDTAEISANGSYKLTHVNGSTWMKKGDGNGNYPETRPLPNGNQITQERVSIGDVVGGNLEFQGWVYFRMQVGPAEEPQENPSVDIYPDRNGQDYAGREVVYNHTIRNTGNVTDSYNINTQSSRGWNVRLSKQRTNPTDPGQTRDLTVWVTIPYNAASTAVDNTVITVTSQNHANVSDRVTDRTTVLQRQDQEAELVLTERVDKTEVQRDHPDSAEREITYTMSITNIGDTAAVNTVLISDLGDNLEGNANFISYGGGERSGNDLIYRIGRIAPGQTVERWFIAHAHNDLTDGFVIRNHSLVSYDTEGESVTEPVNPREVLDAIAWSNWVYTTVRGSALALTVTDNRVTAQPGDTLTYEVTFSNTGSGNAYRVEIQNHVPDYLENIRNISDNGAYDESARTIHWNARMVSGNTNRTFTFQGTVALNTPNNTVLRDDATASANNVTSVSAYDETIVQLAPELRLVELVDKTDVQRDDPTPGATEVTYTLRVTNEGNDTAYQVILRSDLTSVLQSAAVIDLGGGTLDASNILSYPAVDIAPGDTIERVFRVNVLPTASDLAVMTNYFTAEDSTGDIPLESNRVQTVIHAPVLTLSKTDHRDTVEPGQTSTYEITLSNSGSGNAYDVVVVDYVPDYLENITNISHGGTYDATTREITWNLGVFTGSFDPAGISAVHTEVLTFEATVSADAPDGYVLHNRVTLTANNWSLEATDDTTVSAEPNLTLEKEVVVNGTASATARPGDTLTYTLTYSNQGRGVAQNVVVRDIIPTNTTYVSGSATSGGVYDSINGTVTWTIGNLDVGDTGSVSFAVTVNDDAPHNYLIRNNAVVTADGGYEARDSVEVRVQHLPLIFVEKAVDKTNTRPGDILTYTITYGNRSTQVEALNAVLTDELSNYVTYLSGTATRGGAYDSTNHTLNWRFGTLPPRSQYQVTYQVRVNDNVPNGAIIRNTATLTASYVDPQLASVNSLSETGTVESEVTTPTTTIFGPLTKTGMGIVSLIALALTLLVTMALGLPKLKRHFSQFSR
jgi:uncharacterized repeat protein (TIGR01451 family)